MSSKFEIVCYHEGKFCNLINYITEVLLMTQLKNNVKKYRWVSDPQFYCQLRCNLYLRFHGYDLTDPHEDIAKQKHEEICVTICYMISDNIR